MTSGLPQSIPEPHIPERFQDRDGPFSMPQPVHQPNSPPAYSPGPPPPSGYRLALTTAAPFPDIHQTGLPPCADLDGSPVYFGSALFEKSVHPCKIGPHLQPACMVAYGGNERPHYGRYDLLPFTPDTMELVRTSHGHIPPGRRPVEGGYEEHGARLYHAVAEVNGVRAPGKTGEHLAACNVGFGGGEHTVTTNYEILCWK